MRCLENCNISDKKVQRSQEEYSVISPRIRAELLFRKPAAVAPPKHGGIYKTLMKKQTRNNNSSSSRGVVQMQKNM